MQELDLTPFKVEFDRDIKFTDIKPGDIVEISNWSFMGMMGRVELFRSFHLFFKDYDIDSLTNESINNVMLFETHNDGDKQKYEVEALYNPLKQMTILAIYRITKFKY